MTETLTFETEVNQLLKLVINSLYSNKEIFLRELVSNASDALEKLRTWSITQPELLEDDPKLKIFIKTDAAKQTVTIIDNGIGMNRQDAIDHLGTIAKSGTREFLQSFNEQQLKDNKLIGQFGVGFYSAFIVADKVTVESRKAGEKASEGVRWESTGAAEFTIDTINKPERGTKIILHLKKDEKEFLEDIRLRNIITKYSDHIEYPIMMEKMSFAPADEKDKENPDYKPAEIVEEEVVNRATALWTLSKNEIKAEDYNELYKHIGHDFEDPLAYIHKKVEGKQEFTLLLFIPKRAPFDLFQRDYQHGIKLYVKRVFIMDQADQFLPNYLRFIKGIVDSNDLPLNISREILQHNRLVTNIKQSCVKYVLSMLESMAENEPDKYATFWQQFGTVLKEGPAEDFQNKEQIAKLLRFASTHNTDGTQNVTLGDYVKRMKENQNKIYYITGESYAAAKNSPHLEIFRKKGIEVLILSDRVDEWLVSHLSEFDGKQLQSVARGSLDLGEEEETVKEKQEALNKEHHDLLENVQKVLKDKVKEVRMSQRLTDSPACLVADEHDMSEQLKRILAAAGQDVSQVKPILELNPDHSLTMKLKVLPHEENRFQDLALFLYEQSLLAEGGHLEDPAAFVRRVNHFILDRVV